MGWMQKKRQAFKGTLLAASLAAATTSLGCNELEGTLAPADALRFDEATIKELSLGLTA